MDGYAVVTLLAGLALRLGVPLAVTGLLIWLLRRLDAFWQAEGEQQGALKLAAGTGPHCWGIRGCDLDQRVVCPAYLHPDTPCWQHFRGRDGNLRETCLVCDFFRQVPARGSAPRALETQDLQQVRSDSRRTDA